MEEFVILTHSMENKQCQATSQAMSQQALGPVGFQLCGECEKMFLAPAAGAAPLFRWEGKINCHECERLPCQMPVIPFATVSRIDLPAVLAVGKWWLRSGYARARGFGMHNFVIKAQGIPCEHPLEIDHIDRNRLNNSRGNLRVVTRGENLRNRRVPNNTGERFITRVGKDLQRYRVVGLFSSLAKAKAARDALLPFYEADEFVAAPPAPPAPPAPQPTSVANIV